MDRVSRMLGSSTGMHCRCGGSTEVIDSRQDGQKRRRRHRCRTCSKRFTTYEITADEYDRLQSVKVNMAAIKEAIRALEVVQGAVG